MTITIDHGVPMPAARSASKGYTKAMRQLQSGESFLIPGQTSTYASRIIYREKKRRPGSDFASRKVEGGVRIWCLCDPAADMLS